MGVGVFGIDGECSRQQGECLAREFTFLACVLTQPKLTRMPPPLGIRDRGSGGTCRNGRQSLLGRIVRALAWASTRARILGSSAQPPRDSTLERGLHRTDLLR